MAKQLGQITRKYRERNHMSLRALARKSGIGKSYLSVLEKGETQNGKNQFHLQTQFARLLTQ